MATESETTPAPAPVPTTDKRPAHLAAWFDAVTVDEKKAAVAKFAQLKVIFSEAQNY